MAPGRDACVRGCPGAPAQPVPPAPVPGPLPPGAGARGGADGAREPHRGRELRRAGAHHLGPRAPLLPLLGRLLGEWGRGAPQCRAPGDRGRDAPRPGPAGHGDPRASGTRRRGARLGLGTPWGQRVGLVPWPQGSPRCTERVGGPESNLIPSPHARQGRARRPGEAGEGGCGVRGARAALCAFWFGVTCCRNMGVFFAPHPNPRPQDPPIPRPQPPDLFPGSPDPQCPLPGATCLPACLGPQSARVKVQASRLACFRSCVFCRV